MIYYVLKRVWIEEALELCPYFKKDIGGPYFKDIDWKGGSSKNDKSILNYI